MIDPLISLQGVSKAYPTSGGDFYALKDVSAECLPGQLIGVLGKSGAGKTTLINMICGVDHLTRGRVVVGGVSIHDLNEDDRAAWRARSLGVVYQTFHLMPTMTLLDNILLPMDLAGLYRGRKSVERAMGLLEQVELTDHAFKLPSTISGGQQQRVAIARALANDPPLIVADEPTGRLDGATAEVIYQIFENLVSAGKSVLIVSHDLSIEQRFQHLLRLHDGALVFDSRQPECFGEMELL